MNVWRGNFVDYNFVDCRFIAEDWRQYTKL